ncbi:trimethylamine methyltransferase [Candidatus Formimonas warabiya]|uniref:Trimethylamine methyltransferase n=1 Tax=Formimonas warabiya TaxID=1761012 RepID=A0A3G1L0W7_FORW1|nr:trimethylamine methyltransferase [Candidatus Formimonas warabiya]
MLEGGLTWDYAQLVMQNEMVKMILHCVKGIPVNDEKMAMEVIRSVGPGGEFISHEHTFRNFRLLSAPTLLDRHNRDGWKAAGSKDIVTKAYEKARDILENFQPTPLPDQMRDQIREIVKEAEAETAEIKAKEKEASRKGKL